MPDAGNGAEGEERRSSPQGASPGNRLRGSCYEGSDRPTTSSQDGAGEKGAARPGCVASELGEAATRGEAAGPRRGRRPTHGRKTQLGPGRRTSVRAARREAASLLSSADRRVSKLRPSCQSAMPQGMRSRSKRQTHFDRLVEDGAQGALRPGVQRMRRSTPSTGRLPNGRSDQPRPSGGCPVTEAINPNRQTGVQREKGLSLQPPDWAEDEGLSQLRRFGPRYLRRTNVNSASAAFPRGRLGESESSSGHARATGITHPGFLWSETLEKAKQ